MFEVIIGKGNLARKGVYAGKSFKKSEIVIKYRLHPLTQKEYEELPESERMFTHIHHGVIHL